ncbi:hypothetical protein CYLTODRAFT_258095 [Cylindrobasidium torrendii FP15055 ss-10]|uniref:Uncharacterized protein n=1 Tax=Cylindrobasidium torrendii FP15055 ss-10 TaxID=1314674 RepID=A0A0D7BSC9_9AGAR|nr:hypothetical protein CYLTODRAFT_258095 [Cylindrobasidium torrendii FP15055 ss-10]
MKLPSLLLAHRYHLLLSYPKPHSTPYTPHRRPRQLPFLLHNPFVHCHPMWSPIHSRKNTVHRQLIRIGRSRCNRTLTPTFMNDMLIPRRVAPCNRLEILQCRDALVVASWSTLGRPATTESKLLNKPLSTEKLRGVPFQNTLLPLSSSATRTRRTLLPVAESHHLAIPHVYNPKHHPFSLRRHFRRYRRPLPLFRARPSSSCSFVVVWRWWGRGWH